MTDEEALELAIAAHERVLRLESRLESAKEAELEFAAAAALRLGSQRIQRELGLHRNTVHAMLMKMRRV